MTNSTPSDLGRALVAQRKRAVCTCTECGKRFTAYPDALTCSATCRTRRSRRLRAEKNS